MRRVLSRRIGVTPDRLDLDGLAGKPAERGREAHEPPGEHLLGNIPSDDGANRFDHGLAILVPQTLELDALVRRQAIGDIQQACEGLGQIGQVGIGMRHARG